MRGAGLQILIVSTNKIVQTLTAPTLQARVFWKLSHSRQDRADPFDAKSFSSHRGEVFLALRDVASAGLTASQFKTRSQLFLIVEVTLRHYVN